MEVWKFELYDVSALRKHTTTSFVTSCPLFIVTQQLHDIYALDGSSAGFQCSGYTWHDLFGLVIDGEDFPECTGKLPKNITCQTSDNGGSANNKIVKMDINISAVIANNNTHLTCYFHNIDLAYAGTSATFYVTTGKLHS